MFLLLCQKFQNFRSFSSPTDIKIKKNQLPNIYNNQINYIVYQIPKITTQSFLQMQTLTQSQYQSVLLYMQQKGEQNFQQACKILQKYNYDINQIKKQSIISNGQYYHDQNKYIQQGQQQCQQQLTKIRKYLLLTGPKNKKQTNCFKRAITCVKHLCLKVRQKITRLKKRNIHTNFSKIYQNKSKIYLKYTNIAEILKQTQKLKNIFIIISSSIQNPCITQFLNNKNLLKQIILQSQQYYILGITINQLQNKQISFQNKNNFTQPIITKNINSHSNNNHQNFFFFNILSPSILIVRETPTEDLQIVQYFKGQNQILSINNQKLTQLKQKIIKCSKRQQDLIKQIQNQLKTNQFIKGNTSQQFDFKMITNQIQQNNFYHNQYYSPQSFIADKTQSTLIEQQNKSYKQMQKKNKQKQQIITQKSQQIQQFILQRNYRKLSLPQQPSSDHPSTVLKVIFRCPNGSNITHKFLKSEKCQLLFTWVDLNESIQFQMDNEDQNNIVKQIKSTKNVNNNQKIITKDRKFDLLYSYPPQSLKDKIDIQLSTLFESQSQIKIQIKEQ